MTLGTIFLLWYFVGLVYLLIIGVPVVINLPNFSRFNPIDWLWVVVGFAMMAILGPIVIVLHLLDESDTVSND